MYFCDRLKDFRESLELNSYDMSKKLEISKGYYSLIESGKREPSKSVLCKLVKISKKPEQYWVYGVEKIEEIIEAREDFKSIKKAIEFWETLKGDLDNNDLKNLFINKDKNNLNTLEKVLLTALKADLKYYYNNKRAKVNKKIAPSL